jgi:hypothetical protein
MFRRLLGYHARKANLLNLNVLKSVVGVIQTIESNGRRTLRTPTPILLLCCWMLQPQNPNPRAFAWCVTAVIRQDEPDASGSTRDPISFTSTTRLPHNHDRAFPIW